MEDVTLDRPMYRAKRRLLGEPLTTESIAEEKLDNRTALGILASDCISSSAYGSEEMLRVLVPVVGAAAFTLLMPLTGAILLVLLLLTLCYSDVVTLYTRAGGSYVVARENFGPGIAQIAAVALLVDYIVTVAVQVSAGDQRADLARPSRRGRLDGPGPPPTAGLGGGDRSARVREPTRNP